MINFLFLRIKSDELQRQEIIWSVSGAIFVVVTIFTFNYLLNFLAKKSWYIHSNFFPKKINQRQESILRQNYTFYKKLKPKYQKAFNHRVASFLDFYTLISRENFNTTEEVKTLIAGSYVQLTFGMNNYLIRNFDKILIYPKSYLSPITGQYHLGEFNPKMKLIAFSWEDFSEGNLIKTDNYNLGIHEFSHALLEWSLRVEKYRDDYRSSFGSFAIEFRKLIKIVYSTENKEKIQQSGYFRDYAFTNEFELIAVLLENFFESPDDFSRRFPTIFQQVGKMINYNETVLDR